MIVMEDLLDRIESQVPVVYPGCHFQKSGVFVWVAPDKFPAKNFKRYLVFIYLVFIVIVK